MFIPKHNVLEYIDLSQKNGWKKDTPIEVIESFEKTCNIKRCKDLKEVKNYIDKDFLKRLIDWGSEK